MIRVTTTVAIVVALVGGLAPPALAAADAPAAITGTVLSNAGTPIVGLTVQAKSSTGLLVTTTSGLHGHFALTGLRPGTYSLKFSDRVGLCPVVLCISETETHLTTEWLGDATRFATAKKIRLSAGEKYTGVRELVDQSARLTGRVTVNGRPARPSDGVAIDRITSRGVVQDSQLASATFFEDIENTDNYRLRVSSTSNAFTPFYVVDPRDGNTVFHIARVEKITGISISVTIP
jgi:hypothetical protein